MSTVTGLGIGQPDLAAELLDENRVLFLQVLD